MSSPPPLPHFALCLVSFCVRHLARGIIMKRKLTMRIAAGVSLTGLPIVLAKVHPEPPTWALMILLAHGSALLLIAACSLLFAIEYR